MIKPDMKLQALQVIIWFKKKKKTGSTSDFTCWIIPRAKFLRRWDEVPLASDFEKRWLVGGLKATPSWKIWLRQLRDDEIPKISGKMPNWWQPNHQPDGVFFPHGFVANWPISVLLPLLCLGVQPGGWSTIMCRLYPHMPYPWRIRMYGKKMLTKLGFLLMVNVTIYVIHGSYGICLILQSLELLDM